MNIGDRAPDFSLPTDGEGTFTLSEAKSAIVLYFYPKDDTPGCTTEAIDFTAKKEDFAKLGVTIVGASPDPVKKHDKFKAKHDLDVILVSDEDKTMLESFGVWVEKSMYGKTYMGVERSTFLINKDGIIIDMWKKVRVKGHVEAVLASAKENLA